jgi:hypothetical protein
MDCELAIVLVIIDKIILYDMPLVTTANDKFIEPKKGILPHNMP